MTDETKPELPAGFPGWVRTGLSEPDQYRALYRWLNAVLRGATVGFCLRGGLHLVSLAFSLARRSERQRREQSLREKVVETGRYTAFLGALAGVFVGVDEGIAAAWGKARWAIALLCALYAASYCRS